MKTLMKVLGKVFKVIALGLYLIAALLPLYWVVVTSLKGPREIYTFPLKYLPSKLSFESYSKLFGFANFGVYFRNSAIVALAAALAAMLISMFSGYALSRIRAKRFRNGTLLAMYFTQMVPPFILMAPLFVMLANYGMTDRLSTLFILYVTMVIAFSTIMSKSFFDRIPVSLEEAAVIDGCNTLQALFKVVFPLTRPGLAAIFSFAFVNIWNELFLASMFIFSDEKMTVPVALNSFISKAGISWDVLSAGLVVSLLPTMIVFAFAQRYIIAGLTEGAVKG
ncbi:carbohydrate ABC transporter permease [Mesotoga sp. H07.pep.5.3]|uniref:carbohydrate ABC transporter permease n=1 Tax=Mesotoga sp. H07.pep.5.3 TaxID=1421003 RepID=UPI000C196481|nr:carbohydrate ABC transporter permease [Mesotoga sp. H07.pep.5.3]PIJ63370.1 sugar ABC transporter permease [Mesotoga sp. H07.pep.5.3]